MHISVIAPAGKLAPEKFDAGLRCLQNQGAQIHVMPHVNGPSEVFYLAASAETRAAELMQAWLDPWTERLLCVRGGFGSAHILPLLDWEALAARPDMPVIGYSDITALHWAMSAHHVGRPIISSMLGTLPTAQESEYCRISQQKCFSGEAYSLLPAAELGAFRVLKEGRATGKLLAGNLAVAVTLCGTACMPDCSDKILLFEDLNEPIYKLDRYFTQLAQNGILDACRGVMLGQFTDCAPWEQLESLFRRIALSVNGPVVANLPFGHTLPLATLELNRTVTIENDRIQIHAFR